MMGLWIALAVAVVIMGYIRLAPSDPVVWHQPPEVEADRDLLNGVLRRVEAGPEGLERLDAIISGAPRTAVLAGSVAEGMVTYVTRSAVIGFPDYTTVRQAGDALHLHARSRFGRSDMGVNAKRVDGWLAALEP